MKKVYEEINVKYVYDNLNEMNQHESIMIQGGYETYNNWSDSLMIWNGKTKYVEYCLEYKKRLI
jgi:hypothetical protein